MTDLILVQKPEALHIPYFAMEGEPRSFVHRLDLATELAMMVANVLGYSVVKLSGGSANIRIM
jgi:hypothetical protein